MSDRFKHLERGRGDAPEAPLGQDLSRFGAPAPAAAPEAAAAPTSAQARFGPVEERLELEVMQPGEQPFIRCASCAHDNTRFVESCGKCGAALNTPATRAFNEQLWSVMLAETAVETQAHADHLAANHEAYRLDAEQRRQFAVNLAAQVAAQVKRDLDGVPPVPVPEHVGEPEYGPSLAVQLLEKLPNTAARAAVVAAAFALPLWLTQLSVRHWKLQECGAVLLALAVLSFVPLRRRGR